MVATNIKHLTNNITCANTGWSKEMEQS